MHHLTNTVKCRVALSVSTSRSRDGLETHLWSRLVSSRPFLATSRSRLGLGNLGLESRLGLVAYRLGLWTSRLGLVEWKVRPPKTSEKLHAETCMYSVLTIDIFFITSTTSRRLRSADNQALYVPRSKSWMGHRSCRRGLRGRPERCGTVFLSKSPPLLCWHC